MKREPTDPLVLILTFWIQIARGLRANFRQRGLIVQDEPLARLTQYVLTGNWSS